MPVIVLTNVLQPPTRCIEALPQKVEFRQKFDLSPFEFAELVYRSIEDELAAKNHLTLADGSGSSIEHQQILDYRVGKKNARFQQFQAVAFGDLDWLKEQLDALKSEPETWVCIPFGGTVQHMPSERLLDKKQIPLFALSSTERWPRNRRELPCGASKSCSHLPPRSAARVEAMSLLSVPVKLHNETTVSDYLAVTTGWEATESPPL
jgi:hypothetical protein